MKESSFSLSYYFEELKRREDRACRQPATVPVTPTVADRLVVLKSLKFSPDGDLNILTLARSAGIRIGPCQDIVDQLLNEGLVDVESDPTGGNDRIRLSDQGVALT
jgi:hypothetical protein